MTTHALSVQLDQATLRVLYDALRDEYGNDASPDHRYHAMFRCGHKSGVNRAIDLLVELNGGYAPPPIGEDQRS